MIISHLICEVNGKAMPTLSKQNTQTDYVANKYMLTDNPGCNLSRFFIFIKKLNEMKQEIQKSTYFVFHSQKPRK
jgi:hypothetical protein